MPQYCDDWPAIDIGTHRYWLVQNCLWRRYLASVFCDERLIRSKPCGSDVCIQQRRSVNYKMCSSCIRLQIGADICAVLTADAIVTGEGEISCCCLSPSCVDIVPSSKLHIKPVA